ncbi:lipase/acyltransferase domain-containing protein [Streptomyces phaeochromogenes]|uniref:lipase/acyltransferase domain-containing protein n=1 Tax=Streptomyces phaeochromogenes TaxID=1923 RepID=UPI00368280B4
MASSDAVLVLPGIMGSELRDRESGDVLWGPLDPRWYLDAWTTGRALGRLVPTDDERAGRTGRVVPVGLLKAPAFAPVLRGVEPYGNLLAKLRAAVDDPRAVTGFPYDWRLPVPHNAARLADAADRHLADWRRHSGRSDARLVIVAHSMGGLVARHFAERLGGATQLRTLITLGTPFFGAVAAAHILNLGKGIKIPLPAGRLGRLARTLPGLYDLLPCYRCVLEGAGPRLLTPADVQAIGGDPELAAPALADRWGETVPAWLRVVVGVDQRTPQSLELRDGTVVPHHGLPDGPDGRMVDYGGDGTVYRHSATGFCDRPAYWSQKHAALARMDEVVDHVRAVVTETRLGPRLPATTGVGADVPDLVTAGVPFEIMAHGDVAASEVRCRVVTAHDGRQTARPAFTRRDGRIVAAVLLHRPGIYRVEVRRGGTSPVGSLLMALAPDDVAPAED